MLNEEEKEILYNENFLNCIPVILKHFNTQYGSIKQYKENGIDVLELSTGGWSENEDFMDKLCGTMFWVFYWEEIKRGGFYKFKNRSDGVYEI